MAQNEPTAEKMLDTDDAAVTPWAEVRERFSEGTTHWLATVHPDGKPHVVPVGALRIGDMIYVTTGQGTRKGKNLALNPLCTISFAIRGYDVVIEGEAAKVSDEGKLRRIAEA